eukprot:7119128-Ditylum_brightwellii.AAC.1
MTVDKDKNDNIDDNSKESDYKDSVVVMSENSTGADIDENDIVKKYENASIEISDCAFLKNKYSEGLNEAKKGKPTKDASVPDVKAGMKK